jgi:hypothetical protein
MAAKPCKDFPVQAFGPAPVVSAGGRMRAVVEFVVAGIDPFLRSAIARNGCLRSCDSDG